MNVPEYHIAVDMVINRMGEGWEQHELAMPVEKRSVSITIPEDQLLNIQSVLQAAGTVLGMAIQSATYAELKKRGKVARKVEAVQ